MTWIDIYSNSFLTYFERVNQLYQDYILNMQKINELHNEYIKILERMIIVLESYKRYFEDMQRMNQQWLNSYWRPFIGEQERTTTIGSKI
jgi:hypothetical protein